MQNIYNLVNNVISKCAEKPVLITKTKTFSYKQLKIQIENFDAALKKANVKKGSAIAVFLENSIEFISLLFACSKNEITMIPFVGSSKEHKTQLEILKPEFIVVKTSEEFKFKDKNVIKLNQSANLVRINNNSFNINKKNIAFIRMTSGTTGKPKATMLSHETVINRINTATKIVKINENDIIGWPLKMAYHFVVSLILYIKNGATIKLLDEESFLDEKYLKQTSIIYASPNEIKFILDNKINLPSSLHTFFSTSFLLNANLAKRFCEKFKHIILVQLYGMIECGLPIYGEYKNAPQDFWGSIAPDFDYKIENLAELQKENCGLLLLKGKGFFDGYFGLRLDSENTEWFNTGEVIEISKSGKLKILGRLKAAIKLNQNLYFPENIEAKINSKFGTKQSRISEKNGSIFLEYALETKKVDQINLKSFLSNELSVDQIKITINKVKKVKKTISGKIVR